MVVSVPDTADRYYTLTFADFYSEVQHSGRRTTGTGAQKILVIGPGWRGTVPDGMIPVRIRTNQVLMLGRMLARKAPRKIQNHASAVAFHIVCHNFVGICEACSATPAMIAGISGRPLELSEIAMFVEQATGKPNKRGSKKSHCDRMSAFGMGRFRPKRPRSGAKLPCKSGDPQGVAAGEWRSPPFGSRNAQ